MIDKKKVIMENVVKTHTTTSSTTTINQPKSVDLAKKGLVNQSEAAKRASYTGASSMMQFMNGGSNQGNAGGAP